MELEGVCAAEYAYGEDTEIAECGVFNGPWKPFSEFVSSGLSVWRSREFESRAEVIVVGGRERNSKSALNSSGDLWRF
jgi:hypothetical protein